MDEALDWVSENQGIAALTWVAVVFATAVFWFTTKGDSEAAVDFEVPLPKQLENGWQGEVLREPSLKVRLSLCFSSGSVLKTTQFSCGLLFLGARKISACSMDEVYFELVEEDL